MFSGLSAKNLFKTEERLPKNSLVCIHSLQAKPEFNGLLGVVLSFDKEKARYGVRIEVKSSTAVSPVVPAEDNLTVGSVNALVITSGNKDAGAGAASGGSGAASENKSPSSAANLVFPASCSLSLKRANLSPVTDLSQFSRRILRDLKNGKKSIDDYTDAELEHISEADWAEIMEDSEVSAGEDESDGELAVAKVERNRRKRQKRDAKAARRWPAMYGENKRIHIRGVPEGIGAGATNPALQYPFEKSSPKDRLRAENPVLMIGGIGHVDDDDGSNFVSKSLLKADGAWWKRNGCRFISFKAGRSRRAEANIVYAVVSGQVKHVVLGDLSGFNDSTVDRFVDGGVGPALAAFVKDFGGNLLIQSSRGDEVFNRSQFFQKLFPEISWKMGDYYRATHGACTAVNKPNIDRIFNQQSDKSTISFKPLDWGSFAFSIKATLLDGATVPEHERYFATSQVGELFVTRTVLRDQPGRRAPRSMYDDTSDLVQ